MTKKKLSFEGHTVDDEVKKLLSATPASDRDITEAERKLGYKLSREYRMFAKEYGTMHIGEGKVYGLGVREDSPLYVLNVLGLIKDIKGYSHDWLPLFVSKNGNISIYNNTTDEAFVVDPKGNVIDEIPVGMLAYGHWLMKDLNSEFG